MEQIIYLDNAAATMPDEEILEEYNSICKISYANPSSLHNQGLDAALIISNARVSIAEKTNCSAQKVIFTNSGTEANNLAVIGSLLAKKKPGKILVSAIEHPSVIELKGLIEQLGHSFETIRVDNNGNLDLEDLEQKLDNSIYLVSVMYVNNETGVIQDLKNIAQTIKSYNPDILVHSDMVQALGKIPVDLKKSDVDLATFSAHKLHGVRGAGALYAKNPARLRPLTIGGGQENGLRAGTENVAAIAAFGQACKQISLENHTLLNNFKKLIISNLIKAEVEYKNNTPENSSPYILNISFQNFRGEVIVHNLEEQEIYVSTVSACSSKKTQHSHVLKAMQIPDNWNRGTIRISFSKYTTEKEIIFFSEKLIETYKRLKPFMK